MGQNCTSDPPGCVDASAITKFKAEPWVKTDEPCEEDYPGNDGTTKQQQDAVRGGPCWECGAVAPSGYADPEYFTPDHQPPQKAAWHMGGCHDPEKFQEWAESVEAVKPHCKSHSKSQGGVMRHKTISDIRSWM